MINKNKAEVNKLKNIINDALESFDNSELNVYLKDGKVYVAMEEKLLFKTGSSAIDKRGKEAIIKLGKILEKNTDTEILIEGHTDNTGPDKYNWKLSTERALSVVDILTKHTKIKPERITASGRGMHKPVASNKTDAGKQKNRRIEIILVPKLDSLYKIMNEK
ncbi:MAG: OmpA family protein [Hydrogenimonas sp.]|nr:OmpA family protein [Hydrogenimonas sp.]